MLPAFHDYLPRIRGTPPAAHLGLLPLSLLVNREEVLDLAAHMGENLVHRVDFIVARIAIWHGHDLLICLFVIHHVENAHGTNIDHAAGKARFLNQRQRVQRITVIGASAWDEAVISRIVHRRIQRTVETEHAERAVVLVLVARVLGYFYDHSYDFRTVRAGVDVVERGSQSATPTARRLLARSSATSTIMSSCPPTMRRRPSSTRISLASIPYRREAASACRRKLE